MKKNDFDNFIDANREDITNPTTTKFLKDLLEKKNVKPTDLARESLLDCSFTYQLLNGTRNPNRNILLRFAFVLKMNLEETQQLLKISQKGDLYPRIYRDAIIIYCINQKFDLLAANDFLIQQKQTPLIFEE